MYGKLLLADCMFEKDLQLEEAEKRLHKSKSKLALLRGRTSASLSDVETKRVKIKHGSKNGPIDKSDA